MRPFFPPYIIDWQASLTGRTPGPSFGMHTCIRCGFAATSFIMLYKGNDGKALCVVWLMCAHVIIYCGGGLYPGPTAGIRCRFINSPTSLPRHCVSHTHIKPCTLQRRKQRKNFFFPLSWRQIQCREMFYSILFSAFDTPAGGGGVQEKKTRLSSNM